MILVAVSAISIHKICGKTKSENKFLTETVEKDSEELSEKKDEQSNSQETVEKEKTDEDTSSVSGDTKVEQTPTPPVVKEQKKQENSSQQNYNNDKNYNSPSSESTAQEESGGIVDSSGNNKPIENVTTIDDEPWVKAGVSKDDYFTKPVYPWATIDYEVSKCKSLEECEALCMKDAEKLAFTEDVSCIQIYSYSGKYLGEMLQKH